MSVASSAASNISVNYMGQEMSLEQCIDECCRGIQGKLNELQVALRNLAQLSEQEIDEVEDFKEAVSLEDQTVDLISGLTELLEELPEIAADIRGKCPKDCKPWYNSHKAQRKLEHAKAKEEKKEAEKKKKEQKLMDIDE
jgi:hypothetical protein